MTGTFNQVQASGRILLNSGTFSKSGTLTIQAGSIEGNGTIAANSVKNYGTISPGMSAGGLVFNSNLVQQSGSQLVFELGGTVPGTSYDFIDVNGTFAAGGILKLLFLNNFQNSVLPTDTFTLLTANSAITGAFQNVADGMRVLTADGQGSFLVHYGTGGNTSNLVLSNFIAHVPGDFDFDGDVDGADFIAWQTHFPSTVGTAGAGGDTDGDGDVDGADFHAWQTNFPHDPSAGHSPVPEPTSAMSFAAAIVLLAIGRFCRGTGRI
jgi:hypothetical protein